MDQQKSSQGVIDELRRRKVLRSTSIYAVCAWCFLQWCNFLFEQLGWPEWSVTLVLTAVVLGFPVIVALAWVFDISPSGIQMSDPAYLSEGSRSAASWVVDGVVLVIFLGTIFMLLQEGAGI